MHSTALAPGWHADAAIQLLAAAILLIKAAQQWQQQHNDKLPSSSAQRTEFKNIIKSWQRQIDGVPLEVCAHAL